MFSLLWILFLEGVDQRGCKPQRGWKRPSSLSRYWDKTSVKIYKSLGHI